MAIMIMSSSNNSNAIRVSSISAYAIKTLGKLRGRAYVLYVHTLHSSVSFSVFLSPFLSLFSLRFFPAYMYIDLS